MKKLSDGFNNYESILAPEKVYVHTDKDFYLQGETIWAKAYLVNGITHRKSLNSNVLYLEILDLEGFVLSKKRVFADDMGSSASFDIHKNTPQGSYKFRAYTKYMLNDVEPLYFEKTIHIGNANGHYNDFNGVGQSGKVGNTVRLSFHPEGGMLLYDTDGTLVVKSVDDTGNPIAVKGEIINERNEVVTPFDTGKYGLAKCFFKPLQGSSYFIRTSLNSEANVHELSQITDVGYTLTIERLGGHLIIKTQASGSNDLEGTTLVGHMRGERFLWFNGTGEQKLTSNIKVPITQLDEGLANFTLFNKNGEPVSERLVYVEKPTERLAFSLATQKEDSTGQIALDFSLTDAKGKAVAGNFSISVVKNGSDDAVSGSELNIKDWLNLYSDFGKDPIAIEIFRENDPIKRMIAMDALMICSDWKRFSWQDMTKGLPLDKYVAPEKGMVISGTTTSLDKEKKAVPAMVSLNLLGQDIYEAKKQTNTKGRFSFGPFYFNDSLPVALKAFKLNEKSETEKKKVKIELDKEVQFVLPEKTTEQSTFDDMVTVKNDKSEPEGSSTDQYTVDKYDFQTGKEVTRLKEVVVTEKKKTKEELITEQLKEITLYNNPSYRVFTDSLPQTGIRNVVEMFRRIPGVQVKGPPGEETIRIRYGFNSISLPTEPIYLIDGIQVPLGAIKAMTSLEVMFIDVLKGADASIYGVRGANGAIAVYTHRGSGLNYAGGVNFGDENPVPNVLTFMRKGYDSSGTFENKNCNIPFKKTGRSPYGKTEFWNPDVNIKGEKHEPLTFCIDETEIRGYRIKVEGVTQMGRVIDKEFWVNMN